MSDSNIRTFTVTGEAASAIGGTRKRKRRTTAKNETMKVGKEESKQVGGTSPGTTVQIEANKPPGATPETAPAFKNSTETNLAKSSTESSPAPAQAGGKVKVILEKKKKPAVLSPLKVKKVNPTLPTVPAKTRKVAKKIRMSLNGFGKRVTRANTIRVDAKKQSIEDVKKTLIEAKLIKETSKAPESVLRQMYSDYMMLKNRAL